MFVIKEIEDVSGSESFEFVGNSRRKGNYGRVNVMEDEDEAMVCSWEAAT